ncbi:putative Dymeclin [Cocos nucifera]|uniref:Dymeclin n=1 Tax=Cocos nucifera TaxID=13894 RepID=A0A8K0N3P6_COCNU|nr:putative Dymeclin [Cocos nucifera]
MGAVPSTPRRGVRPRDTAENLIGAFVGESSYPLSSEFWKQLLELPLTLGWPQHRVLQACQTLAQNNYQTRHIAKILIHLVWCLQDSMSISAGSPAVYRKAVNAAYISSVFLKFVIENAKSDKFEELCLDLDKDEKGKHDLPIVCSYDVEQSVEAFVMRGVLSFIGASDSCLLHHELLNLMLVAMSTQLCSGPSPGPKDVHPFIGAAMLQDSAVVASVVRRLLLNFINRPRIPFNGSSYPIISEGSQAGVLQRVGSAAVCSYDVEQSVEAFVMRGVLSFIGASDSCLLHHELLNLMLVAMSTQLCSGPSPGPKDVHPFIGAAMLQDSAVVASVVRRLLLNFINRPRIPFNGSSYPIISEGSQAGVLQRVGSAAANFVLLPYYTFNYLVSSGGEGSRSSLADNSLLVLLILMHYRKCVPVDESIAKHDVEHADSGTYSKGNSFFYDNPYCKALENARDIEFDRVDIEGNAQNGPLVRLPFASLFDTLAMCLADESSVLLLYSLVHGNPDFLDFIKFMLFYNGGDVFTADCDQQLMPILEMLYNASRRTSNQIYMLLIILLILSQDSSFNASIHKLMLPSVSWYQERLLHNTSLGSLMVVILIRTVKYNLSKLRDMYLHTNCLAILANMAPHVHRLSAYASQRLVSLFDMLARKYTKLAELKNDKVQKFAIDQVDGGSIAEDMSTELQIYTDFLRIVLEILNAILTYALPRNPEVVYAILHRQEVFQPFKNHPRFNELLENIYTVLDFFNSRMDMQRTDGEWSVDKVLQLIIINCRSWHSDGMKMFNQLRFTYEQENHPEEFFIPYVWRLVLSSG